MFGKIILILLLSMLLPLPQARCREENQEKASNRHLVFIEGGFSYLLGGLVAKDKDFIDSLGVYATYYNTYTGKTENKYFEVSTTGPGGGIGYAWREGENMSYRLMVSKYFISQSLSAGGGTDNNVKYEKKEFKARFFDLNTIEIGPAFNMQIMETINLLLPIQAGYVFGTYHPVSALEAARDALASSGITFPSMKEEYKNIPFAGYLLKAGLGLEYHPLEKNWFSGFNVYYSYFKIKMDKVVWQSLGNSASFSQILVTVSLGLKF